MTFLTYWIRLWLLRKLAGNSTVVINLWATPRGLIGRGWNDVYVNLRMRNFKEGFTVLQGG